VALIAAKAKVLEETGLETGDGPEESVEILLDILGGNN